MNKLLKILAALLVFVATEPINAQKAGIKTNLLYWATGTVNLGAEITVSPKTTLDITLTGNPWVFGKRELNRKIWHWSARPEVRFWHTETFNRGFVGIHAMAGAFDAGGIEFPLGIFPDFKDHRYEGWMAGAGISCGWQWYVSPHWNMEATFGLGYLYLEYNRFAQVAGNAIDRPDVVRHYLGPTGAGVSFIYLFGSQK